MYKFWGSSTQLIGWLPKLQSFIFTSLSKIIHLHPCPSHQRCLWDRRKWKEERGNKYAVRELTSSPTLPPRPLLPSRHTYFTFFPLNYFYTLVLLTLTTFLCLLHKLLKVKLLERLLWLYFCCVEAFALELWLLHLCYGVCKSSDPTGQRGEEMGTKKW